jgi:hypothetical protein
LEKKLGGGRVPSQKQFLDNDRKVLRFFTKSEDLQFVWHYFLADDTVELRECHFPMMEETHSLCTSEDKNCHKLSQLTNQVNNSLETDT